MTTLAHYVVDDLPSTGSAWPARVGLDADMTYWNGTFREDSTYLIKKDTPRRQTRTVETSGLGGQALILLGAVNAADSNLFPAEGNTRTFECLASVKTYPSVAAVVDSRIDLFSGYIGANSDVRFSFERPAGTSNLRLNARIHDATNKIASYNGSSFAADANDVHYLAITVRIVSGVVRMTAFVNDTIVANDVVASPAVGFSYPTFPSGSTAFAAATEDDFSVWTPYVGLLELRVTDELITQALATARSRQVRIINARKA